MPSAVEFLPLQPELTPSVHPAPKLKAPEPEHCPGPESTQAGSGSACTGCPNQSICKSAAAQAVLPDPDLPLIASRLANVKHKLLVLSGKGGVGKSTFSSLLSLAFAREVTTPPNQVGLLDVDVCGPSIPRMMGAELEGIHTSGAGGVWTPVYVADNLAVMSIQFLLPRQDDAVIWRGAKKNGMIKRFLRDVEWGSLDWLVVDTPPGTGDEHLSINTYMKQQADVNAHSGATIGAVLVTTPQEISLLDVRKELSFCAKAGIKVIGLVENMSTFICPNCEHPSEIFPATTGGAEGLAMEFGVAFLGRMPLDPRVGVCADYGENLWEAYPESEVVGALERVVEKIRRIVEEDGGGVLLSTTKK